MVKINKTQDITIILMLLITFFEEINGKSIR